MTARIASLIHPRLFQVKQPVLRRIIFHLGRPSAPFVRLFQLNHEPLAEANEVLIGHFSQAAQACDLRTVLDSGALAAAPAADQKPNRAALARDARRLADEVESLYIQLSQIGALATIRRFMLIHEEGVPNFDLLQTAKALRCDAGTLSLLADTSPKPKPV